MMKSLFLFFAIALLSASASGATYYVSAQGVDTNNGTSKTTPWRHAPGMPNCSNTCASTTPAAGDSVIFRGGDTYHFSASTSDSTDTPMGGEWNWTWSGSSGNTIYLGVDKTWYTGGSWARPIITFDNPTSTAFVTSCSYDDYNSLAVYIHSVNYVTLDNFEFTGRCHATPPNYGGATYINRLGTYITVSNSYFHGWTQTNNPQVTCCMDAGTILAGSTSAGVTHSVIAYNVFDGSDSHCTGNGDCTGWGVYADAYDVHDNVFRYMSNALNSPGNVTTVHDNLFEYMYESYDPSTHGGVLEMAEPSSTGGTLTVYNNVVRHTNIGITFELHAPTGGIYFFNNVFYDIGNGGNCIQIENDVNGTPTTMYFTNNTIDHTTNTCTLRALYQDSGAQLWNGTVHFQNNHLIGIAALSTIETCNSGSTCTWTDNGNELIQTEAVANGQGYTSSNNYAPTSGGSTIHAGANLLSSCSAYSSDSALCSGTSGGVAEVSYTASYPAIPVNARGSTFDAGAYQYLAGSTYTLTVSGAGSGSGTVTGGTISYPGTPSESGIASGTNITLTATVSGGSTFAGFSGGGCSTSPCVVDVTANTTVTATFALSGPAVGMFALLGPTLKMRTTQN
jgi:hypothetical protein